MSLPAPPEMVVSEAPTVREELIASSEINGCSEQGTGDAYGICSTATVDSSITEGADQESILSCTATDGASADDLSTVNRVSTCSKLDVSIVHF